MMTREGRPHPPAIRRRPPRRPRRAAAAAPEALEPRALLASVVLGSAGPIAALTVGDDGSFQVEVAGRSGGQVFPQAAGPGDAGVFLRLADGTVLGLDLAARSADGRGTGARDSQAEPWDALDLVADSAGDRLRATLRAVAPAAGLQVVQLTTYDPADAHFRVDTLIVNVGAVPVTLDVFAAADLNLAGIDKGVGWRDAASGAVGARDATGTFLAFAQPNGAGGAAADALRAGAVRGLWQAIGAGADLDGSVNLPVGMAPYYGDASYVDASAALQWRDLTIAPGRAAVASHFWSFGGAAEAVPLEAAPEAAALPIAATAGSAFAGAVATVALPTGVEAGDYEAWISWGDGATPERATLRPRAGGGFEVAGTHTFAAAGSYGGHGLVVGPGGGADLAESTAVVAPAGVPPVLAASGTLDPASDSGASSTDGVTNINRPVFRGTGTPGASVALEARPRAGGAARPLGTATVDAAGAWIVAAAAPLADGTYAVTATLRLGDASRAVELMGSSRPLVVDTAGPRVVGVALSPRGTTVTIRLADDRAGLDPVTLADAGLFRLLRRTPRGPLIATTASVTPADGPAGAARVALAFRRRSNGPRV